VTAAEAIRAAQVCNVTVHLDGDDLVLEAAAVAPPSYVLDLLSRHKPGVVAMLRRSKHGWTVADWEAFFDERAGIAEHDGGLPRAQAEALAFEHCITEWLMRHPVRSNPGYCLGCGSGEDERGIVLPFGTEVSGHAWLHSTCWPVWQAQRRAEAVAPSRGYEHWSAKEGGMTMVADLRIHTRIAL